MITGKALDRAISPRQFQGMPYCRNSLSLRFNFCFASLTTFSCRPYALLHSLNDSQSDSAVDVFVLSSTIITFPCCWLTKGTLNIRGSPRLPLHSFLRDLHQSRDSFRTLSASKHHCFAFSALCRASMTTMALVSRKLFLASSINLAFGKDMKSIEGSIDILKRAPPLESPAALAAEQVNNDRYGAYMLMILAAVVFALGIYRAVIHSVRYIRTLTCLNNETQRYFKLPGPTSSSIKEHLIYAPLFRRQHRQPVKVASANLGALPSRFQFVFLTAVIAMNIVFSVHGIEWDGPKMIKLHHLRQRTGTLALLNMLPLVIMAGRNNLLIRVLNISFDTFNLCHRWFGRIVVAEVMAHSITQVYSMTYKRESKQLFQYLPLLICHSWVQGFPNGTSKHSDIIWFYSTCKLSKETPAITDRRSRELLPCWRYLYNRTPLCVMPFTRPFYTCT